jgi:hypothetical protein
MPTLTTITGSLYDSRTGTKLTAGTLRITPASFIQNGNDVITPHMVTYSIPVSGDISLQLAPSNGVKYLVEFDPNPADTVTPFRLKPGFFKNTWTVPASGPVNIAAL